MSPISSLISANFSGGRFLLCSSVSHWKCSTISETSTLRAMARFFGEWNCSQSLSSMNALMASLRSFMMLLPDVDPLIIIDTLVSLGNARTGDDHDNLPAHLKPEQV